MPRAFLLPAILALVSTPIGAATSLTVSKGPGPLEITLSYSGSAAPFDVYRSASPQNLTDIANRIGGTTASSFVDTPPAASLLFYSVLGVQTLLFSEYVEGSSNNKAIEILNNGETPRGLGACSLRLFANGTTTPTTTALPSVDVVAGDVFVVCNNGAGAALAPLCDLLVTSGALAFNGDDALDLFCTGAQLDVIGQIGFDPGTEWGSGLNSTQDNTLRRRCSVLVGDPIGGDVFNPVASDWLGLATDTFTGLGDPACAP